MEQQQFIAEEIKKLAIQYHVEELSPEEIDKVVEAKKKLHKLNWLEAQAMAKVIIALKPDVVYVDASDVLPERFKNQIIECLPFQVQVVSEHKADVNYPIVSAASIIAKVERDRAIFKLKGKFGDLGSGYASDPITIEFLKNWVKTFENYPNFVRRSWKPAKRMLSEARAKQGRLV